MKTCGWFAAAVGWVLLLNLGRAEAGCNLARDLAA
jgi:hypothetical protein